MTKLLNQERAMELMVREGLDVLIAQLPVNTYYLSNYWGFYNTPRGYDGSYFAILPRDASAPTTLVIPEAEQARLESATAKGHGTWMENVYGYAAGSSAFEAVARALRAAGIERGKAGADDARTAIWMNEAGMHELNVRYCPQVFNEIRLVKTDAEVELLRRAAHMNEMSLLVAADALQEGSRCDELENMYMLSMAQQGGRGVYLNCNAGTLPVTGVSRDKPVLLDALGQYQHYHGAFGRCFVAGEPSAIQKKHYAHLLSGWEVAQERLQPGVSYNELSEAVGSAVRQAGIAQFSDPRVHSLGLDPADDARLFGAVPGVRADRVLEPNMVISLSLSHNDADTGCVGLADAVRITTYGCERLSSTDMQLRLAGE